MAKVVIRTRLWDLKNQTWISVHETHIEVTMGQATLMRDAYAEANKWYETPCEYKKHVKFSTDMFILDDNGESLGGFVHF